MGRQGEDTGTILAAEVFFGCPDVLHLLASPIRHCDGEEEARWAAEEAGANERLSDPGRHGGGDRCHSAQTQSEGIIGRIIDVLVRGAQAAEEASKRSRTIAGVSRGAVTPGAKRELHHTLLFHGQGALAVMRQQSRVDWSPFQRCGDVNRGKLVSPLMWGLAVRSRESLVTSWRK